MSTKIRSGTGNSKLLKIDDGNRMHVIATTKNEQEFATENGNSYNINSGLMTLTTDGESGVFYLKNRELIPFHISLVVVIMGPSTTGDTSDTTQFRMYKNPTAGTLISTGLAADTNSNRNFSSSKTFTSDTFKGATGNTITNGSVHIESLISPGGRVPFPIDEDIGPNNTVAFSLEPNDNNASMKCMLAIIGHLRDQKQGGN